MGAWGELKRQAAADAGAEGCGGVNKAGQAGAGGAQRGDGDVPAETGWDMGELGQGGGGNAGNWVGWGGALKHTLRKRRDDGGCRF